MNLENDSGLTALHPSAFLFLPSDRRVPPGECGFTSSAGDPGTNGVISKIAAELGIKANLPNMQLLFLRRLLLRRL